jgi:hypothetical protein
MRAWLSKLGRPRRALIGHLLARLRKEQAVKDAHNHTSEGEHRIREAALDETVAGSFPASDPPSSLPNPDEHDAEGSAIEPAEASCPRASRADIRND